MIEAFWRDRRVLVTGNTGFKGSWLCLYLHHLGANVSGYSLPPPTVPSLFELASIRDLVAQEDGDVRDAAGIADAVRRHRPEVVVHMAAQSLVRESYRDPVETYATNIMGVINMLEAVRPVLETRAVLVVTSDKCYQPTADGRALTETDPMGGRDPYSSSKGCAEIVTAAYRHSFFAANAGSRAGRPLALASVRSGNVIGGGDWADDRLVPDMIRAFLDGRPANIRYPDAIRPWQHVLDPLAGYLALARRLLEDGAAFAEGWNFGPGAAHEKPVRYLADSLSALWGDGAAWTVDKAPHPLETVSLRLDSAKANARLDWRCRLSLDDALRLTVEWFKTCQAEGDTRAVCLRQIESYQDLVASPASAVAPGASAER